MSLFEIIIRQFSIHDDKVIIYQRRACSTRFQTMCLHSFQKCISTGSKSPQNLVSPLYQWKKRPVSALDRCPFTKTKNITFHNAFSGLSKIGMVCEGLGLR